MPNLFQTLVRRRGPEVAARSYDLSWYLSQLENPWGLVSGYGTTVRDGRPVEEIQSTFTGYVNGAYKSNGVIFAIILSRLLLFTEMRFQFRRLRSGRTGELFGTTDLSILENPWPNGTTGELCARAEQDASLGGNFFVAAEGDRLRRLRPDWTSIILTAPPDDAVESDVAGYLYQPGGSGEPRLYLPSDVAHWSPIPDPDAQYRGMSWLSPVIREIQADDAATRHKAAFFRNGAKPGLVVSLKESVTAQQFREFMATMAESHDGADNAYKTLYLGGGADVTVAGASLGEIDYRQVQGAGETRLCAAGGVPPVIVGLSEGLQAATYSNYASARRKFGDGWARPQWRSFCAAMSTVVNVPAMSELWYDDSDIAFLREDQADAANIQQTKASTIAALITAGFTPESAVASVDADDRMLLVHTGLVSVQLQPPGQGVPTDPGQPTGETGDTTAAGGVDPTADPIVDPAAARASGADLRPGHDELHHYWTVGKGRGEWVTSPEPWTTLVALLEEHAHVPPEVAKTWASRWFIEVFGYAAGSDKNRVAHGHPPRGRKVGPG